MLVDIPEITVHEIEKCYSLLRNELKQPNQDQSIELVKMYQQHIGEILCGIIFKESKYRQSN